MKRLVLSMIAVAVLGVVARGHSADPSIKLPPLHQISEVTLSPNYGCRSGDEFAKGYANTALFLPELAGRRTSPDLLFNGTCGSEDYFTASTAGDDMSLIADLGAGVRLEELTAARAFNVEGVHPFAAYSKFVSSVRVEANHTYAVLVNLSDRRGLFVFTVTRHVPNKQVNLRYAVKSYQMTSGGQISSPGFSWDQKNIACN